MNTEDSKQEERQNVLKYLHSLDITCPSDLFNRLQIKPEDQYLFLMWMKQEYLMGWQIGFRDGMDSIKNKFKQLMLDEY